MSRVRRVEFIGKWKWLIFWLILFLPIGIVYFALNTLLVEEEMDADKFIEWHRSKDKR